MTNFLGVTLASFCVLATASVANAQTAPDAIAQDVEYRAPQSALDRILGNRKRSLAFTKDQRMKRSHVKRWSAHGKSLFPKQFGGASLQWIKGGETTAILYWTGSGKPSMFFNGVDRVVRVKYSLLVLSQMRARLESALVQMPSCTMKIHGKPLVDVQNNQLRLMVHTGYTAFGQHLSDAAKIPADAIQIIEAQAFEISPPDVKKFHTAHPLDTDCHNLSDT